MNITVAVVDDHELIRDEISLLIEQMGFHLLFKAENGKVALEIMEQDNKVPDVCILDIRMSVMDGYETAQIWSIQYPKTKILACSFEESETAIINMIEAGASGFLSKGSPLTEMKKAIEDVFNIGYYFGSGVANMLMTYFRENRGK